MSKAFVHIFLLCGLSSARHVRRSADDTTVASEIPPAAPDTILPVQHVREVSNGNSPEGIARLYIIAKQKAEESKATTAPPAPAADPSADPATKLSAGDELPPVIDGPTKPPFNDTTPFSGIDVSEVMELRIVKPLCDY
ncbi:hypothetical protein COOONC_20403 [Cooperia oncophora]